MNIDKINGDIYYGPFKFHARMSLDEFKKNSAGLDVKALPVWSERVNFILPPVYDNDVLVESTVGFIANRIKNLYMDVVPRTLWAIKDNDPDRYEDIEVQRFMLAPFQEDLLLDILGSPPYIYEWGSIEFGCTDNGGPLIKLHYK